MVGDRAGMSGDFVPDALLPAGTQVLITMSF